MKVNYNVITTSYYFSTGCLAIYFNRVYEYIALNFGVFQNTTILLYIAIFYRVHQLYLYVDMRTLNNFEKNRCL